VAQEAAAALNASDRLQVLAGTPLPAGWTGKLWAMNQGIAAAALLDPDYLLLTDADIHHEPGNVASLVAVAQAHDCDLVSSMVQLSVNTVAEKCLIPLPRRGAACWCALVHCRVSGDLSAFERS
jgi:glycosyltransferase involved in cell wall biosynthesis